MAVPEQLKAIQNRTRQDRRQIGAPSAALARTTVNSLLAKKGGAISVMDMHEVSGIADFFVICTATSDVQARALAGEVQDAIRKEFGERPWHVEGLDSAQWVLIDYVNVVVHIMMPDAREFYGLERLWGDAPTESVADDAVEPALGILAVRRRDTLPPAAGGESARPA